MNHNSTCWFSIEHHVEHIHDGTIRFTEMNTGRQVTLGGNFVVTQITREEYDKYSKRRARFEDVADFLLDGDASNCEKCD